MTEERIQHFDLNKIAGSGQCFRMTPTGDGAYQLIAHGRRLLLSQDGPAIRFGCTREEFDGLWRDYFDLGADYESLGSRVDPEDRFLQAAVRYGCGIRILRQDPWETLVSFIISQRKNIPAIVTAVEALCRRFGEKITDEGGEYHTFPSARRIAGLSEGDLLACTLGYRAKYVLSTARAVDRGDIDPGKLKNLSNDELLAALMTLDGVGLKVANCVMLFAYHRVDAFPVDVWIDRMIATEYGGRFPLGRYRGCAGILQQYIFYYARSDSYRRCMKPVNQNP